MEAEVEMGGQETGKEKKAVEKKLREEEENRAV